MNLFWTWRKELNLLFLEYDAKNWFFLLICLKDLNFLLWLKELIFLNMTQRIEFLKYDSKELNLFFWNMTQKSWIFFFWNVTQKNWIFFFWLWLKRIESFFYEIWLKRIEPFITIWLNALNHFFVLNMTQRIELLWVLLKVFWIFRIFYQKIDSQNWTFFEYDLQNWTFFLKIWVKDLNLFLIMWLIQLVLFSLTQCIENFLNTTQRIELFFF